MRVPLSLAFRLLASLEVAGSGKGVFGRWGVSRASALRVCCWVGCWCDCNRFFLSESCCDGSVEVDSVAEDGADGAAVA